MGLAWERRSPGDPQATTRIKEQAIRDTIITTVLEDSELIAYADWPTAELPAGYVYRLMEIVCKHAEQEPEFIVPSPARGSYIVLETTEEEHAVLAAKFGGLVVDDTDPWLGEHWRTLVAVEDAEKVLGVSRWALTDLWHAQNEQDVFDAVQNLVAQREYKTTVW